MQDNNLNKLTASLNVIKLGTHHFVHAGGKRTEDKGRARSSLPVYLPKEWLAGKPTETNIFRLLQSFLLRNDNNRHRHCEGGTTEAVSFIKLGSFRFWEL